MLTPIRMKKKMMNKIHLDASGQMAISAIPAASDAASKGVSAQLPNPLTPQETVGLPNGVSVSEQPMTSEQSTGAPTERMAPDTLLEADRQPPMKQLEEAPSQTKLPPAEEAALAEVVATPMGLVEAKPEPATKGAPAPAPNEQISATPVLAPTTGNGTVVGMTETK